MNGHRYTPKFICKYSNWTGTRGLVSIMRSFFQVNGTEEEGREREEIEYAQDSLMPREQ